MASYLAGLALREQTPLMVACDTGHEGAVVRLLRAGADPSATDRFGWTALMQACGRGHLKIVSHLLRAGADVGQTTRIGDTALIIAMLSNRDRIVELLLQRPSTPSSTTTTYNDQHDRPFDAIFMRRQLAPRRILSTVSIASAVRSTRSCVPLAWRVPVPTPLLASRSS
ncbi:hypothetical protein DIPPA_70094 [Diplonema papillatum]|nr:hypothetical protein DIPPA_70094 [Diplonema papillatum]